MKSVLISIQPKWCELIASGKKTIEVRKTRPKIDTPFKCYIYCTQGKDMLWVLKKSERTHTDKPTSIFNAKDVGGATKANGKVIGEFVCDEIKMSLVGYDEKGCPSYWDILDGSCLTPNELVCYGEWKALYGWHISDLVIYDKPKELSEVITICPEWEKGYFTNKCLRCEYYFSNCAEMRHECTVEGEKRLTRPPQSWCYVEGVE